MTRSTVWRALVVVLSSFAVLALGSCHHAPPPTPLPPPPTPRVPLVGFVDLHAHPMANLGFAGKLVYGGVDWAADGGALLPSDPDCNQNVRALSLAQQLGHDGSTHGDWGFHNTCGDYIRTQVISVLQTMNNGNNPPGDATGAPDFGKWPESTDVSHQVMWSDAIRRTYDAGLRVMVALAVNNTTLADTVAGPGDGPDDDQSSADLQIAELKLFVARHSDFMEIAYSSDDLQRIVAANHLAVVLGLEVDNIGDFNTRSPLTHDDIRDEIERLRAEGVRYLFPVHLIDNPFGTTAAYQDIFDLSNLREAGHFWNLQCAAPTDNISYRLTMTNPLRDPFSDPLTAEMALLMLVKLHLFSLDDPAPPPCPMDGGVLNRGATYPGLTPDGTFAVGEMMRQCMLLDVDHMSMASANDMLALAVDAGYPVNSGHNNLRSVAGGQTERQLTAAQYAQIASVHGMAGVGSARQDEVSWLHVSQDVLAALGDGGVVGFGTDSDGVSPLMPPPRAGAPGVTYSSSYPKSSLGGASWDYNDAGVAHYGMLSDFLQGLGQLDGGPALVSNMMQGAQAFHDTWQRAEAYCTALAATDGGTGPHHHLAMATESQCPAGTVLRPACGRCLAPRESCPPCEADAGQCLPAPQCPAGRTRNLWGVCSAPAHDTGLVEAPLKTKLARVGPGGVSVPAGKYVLTLTSRDGKQTAFSVELAQADAGWVLRGKKEKLVANGGFAKGLWTMQWVVGKRLVMLLARPEAGKPVAGGFALHWPGTPTVLGAFTLQPATAALLKTAQPLDNLPALLETLH